MVSEHPCASASFRTWDALRRAPPARPPAPPPSYPPCVCARALRVDAACGAVCDGLLLVAARSEDCVRLLPLISAARVPGLGVVPCTPRTLDREAAAPPLTEQPWQHEDHREQRRTPGTADEAAAEAAEAAAAPAEEGMVTGSAAEEEEQQEEQQEEGRRKVREEGISLLKI